MNEFLNKFGSVVTGVLSGFDRLVFRGTLRCLSYVGGVVGYLLRRNVQFVDYGSFVERESKRLVEASLRAACEAQRPILYLASSRTSKEEVAAQIARRDGIERGLVCVLKCVEPCMSFELHRDRETKKARIESRKRKCLFLYHYWMDPEFGMMSGRIQTWLPYSMQICLNGREWLARRLDRAGIGYERADNCFPWIADVVAAQRLLQEQLKTDWPAALQAVGRRLNPAHEAMLGAASVYYWTVHQSEWATDVMFQSSKALAAIYPQLTRGAILCFNAEQVMRYVRDVEFQGLYQGRIVSDLRRREEGVRIKHWVGQNSVKMYDKPGGILRIEATINDPVQFKAYRPKEGLSARRKDWLPMRRGVADLHRRAEVSHAATQRYADALASLNVDQTAGELVEAVCCPTRYKRKRIRALQPWSPHDHALLQAVARGEWTLNGMRNRDLRALLYPNEHDEERIHKLSAHLTRQLRMLRAHGLIRKVSRTQRYRLTTKGRKIATVLAQTKNIPVKELMEKIA